MNLVSASGKLHGLRCAAQRCDTSATSPLKEVTATSRIPKLIHSDGKRPMLRCVSSHTPQCKATALWTPDCRLSEDTLKPAVGRSGLKSRLLGKWLSQPDPVGGSLPTHASGKRRPVMVCSETAGTSLDLARSIAHQSAPHSDELFLFLRRIGEDVVVPSRLESALACRHHGFKRRCASLLSQVDVLALSRTDCHGTIR